MKRAVILHGTDGAPEHNWFPWLKKELQGRGYQVWVPSLPNNHTPDRRVYNDFLLNNDWDFTDNLIIGHSSGAVSVLNLLEDERCPRISTGVLVSPWYDSEKADLAAAGFTAAQFEDLFPAAGYNFDLIRTKVKHLLFMHGDNDPYCPIEQTQWLAKQTGSELITVHKGSHLSQDSGFYELPQLTDALEQRGWLQ